MSYTHTFLGFRPPPRYDGTPFTGARVEEAATEAGPFAPVETLPLTPPDTDPSDPQARNLTTDEATLPEGWFVIVFVDALGGESPASEPVRSPSTTQGTYYGNATALAAALDVTVEQAATVLLDATEVVDGLLGAWIVDPNTGLKIVENDVEAWQWTKLARATEKLAAELHRNPRLLSEQKWTSVSGPDFTFSGAQGSVLGSQFLNLLDGTGLRRLATRAHTGGGGPLIARRFFTTLNPTRRYRR